jgi:Flp pilus assembly protein TadD
MKISTPETWIKPEPNPVAVIRGDSSPRLASWLVPLLMVGLTFTAFLPALQNGFLTWDDGDNLVGNLKYRGVGWAQLRWMFTTFHSGHYQPLTWMSFDLDYLLWGLNPFGYHLTSVLLHCANAVLFYFVVRRLLRIVFSASSYPTEFSLRCAAGIAALFFSIHPLRVESVAWATERRDVLSGFFLLSTLICYLKATAETDENAGRKGWVRAAVTLYGMSLLSKAGGMTLPAVLVILDIYPLKRLEGGPTKWFRATTRRVWLEKVPFLILALAAMIVASIAQYHVGAMRSLNQHGLLLRLTQALFGLVFYVRKTFLPLGLSPLYELPVHLTPWDWPFLWSGVITLIVSLILFAARRHWPAGLAIWVCYGILLAPVLGVAQSGPQLVADRYSYVSCLGWAILVGGGVLWGWFRWADRLASWKTIASVMGTAAAIVLISLGVLTWKQSQIWYDDERLWRYALTVVPESSIAHYNLALILEKREGKLEEAGAHLRKALELNPAYAKAYLGLGNVLLKRGESDEAISQYRLALQIDPTAADVHVNLGNALALRGELDEAIHHYRQALELDAASQNAHYNLGNALALRGQLDEAIEHYRETSRINPAHSEAHFSLANALVARGQLEEAIDHYQEAVKINPDDTEAYHNLGRVLAAQGQLDRAVDCFRKALSVRPDFVQAQESLKHALAEQGKRTKP